MPLEGDLNMKLRNILFVFLFICAFLIPVREVFASELTVDIETPFSSTNKKDLYIGFVALDIQNRPVTVKCYVKRPGESFVQFDSTKNLLSGGTSDNCHVTDSVVTGIGVYQFFVTATADSTTQNSATVSVDFDDSAPGTPTNYSRQTQPDGCSYKISFKTANDGGETVKVALYRTDTLPFTADNASKIQEVGIGSNQDGSFFAAKPDCSKTYYFALRAFDSHGNGSGLVGDPEITTQSGSETVLPGGSVEGAQVTNENQVVQGENGGSVLGEEAEEGTESGEIQEDNNVQMDSDEVHSTQVQGITAYLKKPWVWAGLVIIVIFAFWYVRRRSRS